MKLSGAGEQGALPVTSPLKGYMRLAAPGRGQNLRRVRDQNTTKFGSKFGAEERQRGAEPH
jgi:hypothetical protein